MFGVGEHEGTHYHAMQFIQGQGLDAVIEEVKRLRREKSQPAPFESGMDHPDVDHRPVSAIVARAMTDGTFANEAQLGGGKSDHGEARWPPVDDDSDKRLSVATRNECGTTPERLPESSGVEQCCQEQATTRVVIQPCVQNGVGHHLHSEQRE